MFLLIATGGSCHRIAAERDRLPPSISAASKDKIGNISDFFLFLIILCIFKENKL